MVIASTGFGSAARAALVMVLLGLAAPALGEQTSSDARRSADEQEMLAKARQEAEDRRRASARRLEGTVNIGSPQAGASDSTEAKQREAELQRLSDKLRRASALRTARPAQAPVGDWKTDVTALPATTEPKADYRPESRSALGHKVLGNVDRAGGDVLVTVLMVLTPGDRGIRRGNPTADPILCSNDGCYVSNGSATPARYLSLRRSFGFINTFGPRAGACRQQTACVFRGVDVTATNSILQPVDLRVMHHDRRAIKAALIDETCRVDAGRLTCDKPIRGDDFILWVVPESVASRAGSDALQRAVAEGLPDDARRAALGR